MHEEVFRGSVSQALDHFAEPRGEFVLLLTGADPPSGAEAPTQSDLEAASAELVNARTIKNKADNFIIASPNFLKIDTYAGQNGIVRL